MAIAANQISKIITDQTAWATKVLEDANNALAILGSMEFPYTTFGTLTNPVVNLTALKPSDLAVAPSIPAAPAVPDIQAPSIPAAPVFTFPGAPQTKDITIPNAPAITMPTMATVTLAAMLGITIPSAPSINFGDLSVAPPEPINISPAAFNFYVDNIDIEGDSLYQAIRQRILDNVNIGGSGLKPEIEQAIWDRDLERNQQQLMDTTDKVITMWAKKGFSLPDGILAHSLSETQKEYMNRLIDRSREIGVEQAKLEQANIFKSMEIGNGLFLGVKDLLIKHQDLILRAQEDIAKFFNEYITLQVQVQNSIVETYKARVQAYEIEIRAKLGQVEVYKAQLEGEMTKAKINEQNVAIYSAQITAEIARYRGVLDANKSIVDIFSSQIQAVLAQAQVNEETIKMYAEQVRAVLATAEVYTAQVSGLEAIARVGVAEAEISKSRIDAWAKQVEANMSLYQAEIEKYKAENAYNISSAELVSKIAEINGNLLLGTAKINESYAELSQKSIQAKAEALLYAAKGVAEVAGHMSAGAMAALSAGASMGYSETLTLQP